MIAATCEKTGLTFEARSQRQTTHPQIRSWIDKSYKDGWYQACLDAIKAGREASLESIEEFIALLSETEHAAVSSQHADYSAMLERQRQAKEARRQRAVTNDLLRDRGYRWQNLGFKTEEEADAFDINLPIGNDWQLISPDGRIVTVKEAMQELAYHDVKFAKEWLATRGIAEEMPAIERERKAKQEQAEQEQCNAEQLDEESKQYFEEAQQALRDAGLEAAEARSIALRWSGPHSPASGVVSLGPDTMLDDGRHVYLAFCDDLRYGVVLDGKWRGITSDEIPQKIKDQLLKYTEK